MTQETEPPLLKVENLRTHFPIRTGILQRVTGHLKAVDDVSFEIREGETLGLVGESAHPGLLVWRRARSWPARGGRIDSPTY